MASSATRNQGANVGNSCEPMAIKPPTPPFHEQSAQAGEIASCIMQSVCMLFATDVGPDGCSGKTVLRGH